MESWTEAFILTASGNSHRYHSQGSQQENVTKTENKRYIQQCKRQQNLQTLPRTLNIGKIETLEGDGKKGETKRGGGGGG